MTPKPHFSILATSFAGGPRPRNAALILSGLWLLLFFAALFAPPLLDDADATHALAAQSMARTGDLVTLHVNGIRYLEKAPLPYWLVALSIKLFGFNTFAAHLPQAVAVLLLVLLGHRWANQAFGARTGFYTSIALLTSIGVFLFTRILIPEIWLSLFLAASLFAFLKSIHPNPYPVPPIPTLEVRETPAIAWYAGPAFYAWLTWATLAFAVLSKGLVALVFFFATTILYLTLTKCWSEAHRLRPLTGILLFLAIAAPWHILAGLRNTGGADGHGFFWFYFINEHVLRFLGRRLPMDYNKLPGFLYWGQHLLWLFPWTLFLPLGYNALNRRQHHQVEVLTAHAGIPNWPFWILSGAAFALARDHDPIEVLVLYLAAFFLLRVALKRRAAGLPASPFHRIDAQQRSILLLSLFAGVVLLFFSFSTNQEYYTFPAYLPILLLVAATITRAEQTYSTDPNARRWLTFAHATFLFLGTLAAAALLYGLWSSRHLPYVANIGDLLAHRSIGNYTLSTSHLFDLTTASFAALRLPAALAAVALTLGPLAAWMLRVQRRHIAATTAIAFTSAAFLVAAQIAFTRFAPLLSSQNIATRILSLEHTHAIAPDTEILLYGDQAFGSSISFYTGRPIKLVNGRSTSMLFGSTFPDAPEVFLTDNDLRQTWGKGKRKLLFIPQEMRNQALPLVGPNPIVLTESSGKLLLTDRPLETSAQ